MKIILLFYCFIFFSCTTKKSKQYSDFILGDWSYLEENKSPDSSSREMLRDSIIEGYSFSTKEVCEKKLGFFKHVTTKISGMEKAYGAFTERTTRYFLGTETKYKIDEDSLKIFDLADSSWQAWHIINLSSDTLTIEENEKEKKFIKKDYTKNKKFKFDQVVISSSACFGECSINNIIIDKSGEAVYYGERYNSINGLYSLKLSKNQIDKIVSAFNKADITNLKNYYAANWHDDQVIDLTFVKDGKIIKSIRDYGNVAPVELYWAYMPIRNMYQIMQLDTLDLAIHKIVNTEEALSFIQYTTPLSYSEEFYFLNLLRQATETKEHFITKYELSMMDIDEIIKVETDGRFYNFKMKDGTEKTLDIGYNFIETNEIGWKFNLRQQAIKEYKSKTILEK